MKNKRFEIIKTHLTEWYETMLRDGELEDISQNVAQCTTNDFETILEQLKYKIGNYVEDGELDGLAMVIARHLEELEI